ncbi:unnamed protein product [Eruca vesicaria subsp. sativa]|uniref:Uncharacterized protein n=1 Tax=Eruca vesicaria subsp. sativa TaxID=29727 RepID=A0ABC8ISG2_ERUVS|nr:unnamed protein product [Eruca vesicaria subsp. sativa]
MATEYERRRLENIRRNDEMMASLNVHAKASLLSASTKRSRDPSKKNKKTESETPISLRTRGVTPDSEGLPHGVSDCPKGLPFPHYVSLRVLAPLPLDDGEGSHSQLVDTLSGIARKPNEETTTVNESDDGFDLEALCLEPCNVKRVVPERVLVVKFLPCEDVKLVAAGDKDGNVGFWNLDCEEDSVSLFKPHTGSVTSLVFQQNSFSKVITSSNDGLIRLMDVEKMVFDLVYSRDVYEPIHSLSQRPNDEQSLYFGEGEGMINVWDLRAGKSVFSWELHKYRIHTIDFNTQNTHLMATSSQDRTACLWDLRTMGAKKPKVLTTVDHAKAVYSAYFSPSGLSLATTSRDNYVGVISGANFEDTSMIYHCNNTGRNISSFRGVWGWDDSHIFVGNVGKGIGGNQTKGIDVISTKLKRTVKKLKSPLVKDAISRLHCHPLNVGMLAGSTAGGHVYVWTTK